jgi:hypothetical protein
VKWWQIDLGEELMVDELIITNRYDCCWDRLSGFEVLVDGTTCATGPSDIDRADSAYDDGIPVDCHSSGQIVKIQIDNGQQLTLC